MEYKLGSESSAIQLFYSIRTKAYLTLVSVKDIDKPATQWMKRSLKGSVLRARAENLTLEDYLKMGDISKPPGLHLDMRRIRSRDWRLYFVSLNRGGTTPFDRKRFLLSDAATGNGLGSGATVPFGFLSDNVE